MLIAPLALAFRVQSRQVSVAPINIIQPPPVSLYSGTVRRDQVSPYLSQVSTHMSKRNSAMSRPRKRRKTRRRRIQSASNGPNTPSPRVIAMRGVITSSSTMIIGCTQPRIFFKRNNRAADIGCSGQMHCWGTILDCTNGTQRDQRVCLITTTLRPFDCHCHSTQQR